MVLKETCVYCVLSPGEGGPSCGKSRRQLSGLSTEPGCCRQACTGWLGCLPSARKMGAEELSSLYNADWGENGPCLGHNPNGFGILKLLWPGASLGCLEGVWAVLGKVKT